MHSFKPPAKNLSFVSILIFLIGGIIANALAQATNPVPRNVFLITAQTTNSIPTNLFLTDDGFLLKFRKNNEMVVNTKSIKEAQTSKESRPANQDPEGHWGDVSNGFQLSLRFEKRAYLAGESIAATVLLRNVSEGFLNYTRVSIAGHPSPIDVSAAKDQKSLNLKGNADFIEVISATPITIFPRTQHKYTVALEKFYDLSQSGEYVFQASYRSKKGVNDLEITSQKATITITNASATSTK